MTARRHTAWWSVVLACAVTVAGCGSASTGRPSAAAVQQTVRDYGGPDGKVHVSRVIVQDADDGTFRELQMVTVCRPAGGCRLVAPDGVGYPDLETFIDDTELIDPGDTVLANANMASPGAPVQPWSYTKAGFPWAWVAGGGAAVLVLLGAVWLVRARRRRAEDRALLHAWEAPQPEA